MFLIGYCNLYKLEPKEDNLQKINSLASTILELQTSGYSGACWGYNFDWQARAFFQPKVRANCSSNIIYWRSPYRSLYNYKKRGAFRNAISCSEFVLNDLNRSYDEDNDFTFSYSPLDSTQVYNAGLLGAKLLSLVYLYNEDPNLLATAKKVVSYVCKKQTKEGAWPYGTLALSSMD